MQTFKLSLISLQKTNYNISPCETIMPRTCQQITTRANETTCRWFIAKTPAKCLKQDIVYWVASKQAVLEVEVLEAGNWLWTRELSKCIYTMNWLVLTKTRLRKPQKWKWCSWWSRPLKAHLCERGANMVMNPQCMARKHLQWTHDHQVFLLYHMEGHVSVHQLPLEEKRSQERHHHR